MKSSRPVSAHCRSSNTRTVVPRAAMRSKKRRQAANSRSRPPAGASPMPSRVSSACSIHRARSSSVTYSATVAAIAVRVVGFVVALGQAGPAADHLAQRPESDPFAIGRAAAAVPVDRLDHAVDVLLELPGEAALADAGRARDRHEPRRAGRGRSRWSRSFSSRSSSSRPTNGASSVSARPAPPRWAMTRSARHAGTGAGLALERLVAGRLRRRSPPTSRASSTRRRAPRLAARPTAAGRRC